MSSSSVTEERQHAHELIDRLEPAEVPAAVRLLESMLLDPVSRAAFTAAADDEPLTDEDRRRLHQGQAWFDAQPGGRGIPMEDVLADFGLKPEDFPLSTNRPK